MSTVTSYVRAAPSKTKWVIGALILLLIAMALLLLAENHRSALQRAENNAMIPALAEFNLQFLRQKGLAENDYLEALDGFAEQHRGSNLIEDYQARVRAATKRD